MKRIAMLCLVLGLTGCFEYSNGYRVGIITKFSEKGLMCKTWEGEMALSGLRSVGKEGGTAANLWEFSVDSRRKHGEDIEAIVRALQAAQDTGRPVKIHYVQEWAHGPCRSSSSYFVQSVEVVE